MISLLRSIWERLTLYLPVVLMGVLALGTYWLVENAPELLVATAPTLVKHEPDYFMRKFSIRTFDGSGHLKTEVLGTDARHYPDVDTLEIDTVHVRAFDELGRLTTASAARALTQGDASELKLFGGAQVLREAQADQNGVPQPRLEFRGEFLHAFLDTRRVTSHLPVQLTRGNDRFTGDSMDFDDQTKVFRLTGRVRGALAAQPGR